MTMTGNSTHRTSSFERKRLFWPQSRVAPQLNIRLSSLTTLLRYLMLWPQETLHILLRSAYFSLIYVLSHQNDQRISPNGLLTEIHIYLFINPFTLPIFDDEALTNPVSGGGRGGWGYLDQFLVAPTAPLHVHSDQDHTTLSYSSTVCPLISSNV